jgi:hypothetical protein
MDRIMFKIIFAIICIVFYAHLYIHFIINPNNECELFHELTKEEVTNAVYKKLPFVFDATTLNTTYALENKKIGKKYGYNL